MGLLARITLAFSALALGAVLIVGVLSYRGVEDIVVPQELHRLEATTHRLARNLELFVAGARSDVVAIARGPLLPRVVAGVTNAETPPASVESLEAELAERFRAELLANPHYLQLRLIRESSGRELVRVDRRRANGEVHRVDEDQLQRKLQRRYYQEARKLEPGQVFVSPVELNRERGEIENPEVPVLRVAMPVYVRKGALFGVLVLNIDMSPAFTTLTSSDENAAATYLVNADGDFLVHPDPEVAFAFERGAPARWMELLPELDPILAPASSTASAITSPERSPIAAAVSSTRLAGGPVVRIVRTIDAAEILAPARSIRTNTIWSASIALIVALLGGLGIAHSMTRPLRATTRAVEGFEAGQVLSIPDADASEIGTLARALERMSVDLRDRIQAENKMSAQIRDLQRLESIGQLATGIAHDFNNLLTIIIGYSNDVVEDLPEDAALQEPIEKVIEAAESAAALTHQLLAFSRRQVLQPVVLDLNECVRRLEPLLRRLIREDIDMVVLPGDDLRSVRADAIQIEQILMNLVANARDAMPSGGSLTLELKNVDFDEDYVRHHAEAKLGPHVCIAVTDGGIGMRPDELEKIFDPFYTTKELGRGTGLGLSTVYGIVKQSEGHIWVYSEPGSGTIFKIYLPCASEEDVRATSTAAIAAPPRVRVAGAKQTILLVEDDEGLRKLISRTLEKGGYSVLCASNGEEAMEAYGRGRGQISALLTDVVLPRAGGRAIADALRALEPSLIVIFMSGYTDDSIVHRGILEAGTNFIEKPIAPKALLERIRAILDEQGPAQA